MFGYEKGAFTGAVHAQAGKLEQAQKGTLLLDEVSEMPLALQAKLLRVLQEREVERVGGRKSLALDIRVIATSNRDLPTEVAKGNFREDLYYRLNVFPLEIPPLRERPDDIVPLARELLSRFAARAERGAVRLTPEAEACLRAHPWPGNVRELENALQRALILTQGYEIGVEDIQLAQPSALTLAAAPAATAPRNMKSLEREHILDTLAAVNGSRKLAVERLGISERTLRYKLRQYRLSGAM
jgi:two-component system response regulator FlrC